MPAPAIIRLPALMLDILYRLVDRIHICVPIIVDIFKVLSDKKVLVVKIFLF